MGSSMTVERNSAAMERSSASSTNAMAGRPISRTIRCRVSASRSDASETIPAGLPPRGVSEKAVYRAMLSAGTMQIPHASNMYPIVA